MKLLKASIFYIIVFSLTLAGCDRMDLFSLKNDPSAKSITSFSFVSPSVNGTIDQGAFTINVTVPFGTDVTALQANFVTTGTLVQVGGMDQVSGVTTNNFSTSVTYTVTAEDSSTQDYIVTVIIAPSSAKAITAFSIDSPAVSGTINETLHTIDVTVPFGTDVTTLVASFSTTGTLVEIGSTAQTSGSTSNDFTSPVVYTVTAADSSTQNYTVTVTIAPSSEKAITSFSIVAPAVSGTINETLHTIDVTVPFGTSVTNLVATFTTTGNLVEVGSTAQTSGSTSNDFTSPVIYTVTADDSSTQNYTVTVTVAAGSSEKAITEFSFETIGVKGAVDEAAFTIDVVVPLGTDIANLVATFTTTGVLVEVGSIEQFSGSTANDYNSAVIYTVTAQDTTIQNYTVTVTEASTPYEILNEAGTSNSLFGWRSSDGATISAGQSVLIGSAALLESFAFKFSAGFGAEVTLRLNVMDDTGEILTSYDVLVPMSFTSGWVTWSGLNLSVKAGTTLIFGTYLVGGYDTNHYVAQVVGDWSTDAYAGGQRYVAAGQYNDAQMDDWSNWNPVTYDMHFHLQGITP